MPDAEGRTSRVLGDKYESMAKGNENNLSGLERKECEFKNVTINNEILNNSHYSCWTEIPLHTTTRLMRIVECRLEGRER
jgi:hypothetical protein